MTKDELKNTVKTLDAGEQLEGIIFDLIDEAPVVDQILLNKIADMLDMQSSVDELTADALEQEAAIYRDAAAQVVKQMDVKDNQAA